MSAEVRPIQGKVLVPTSSHMLRSHGPFQVRRIRPGVALRQPNDPGFGGLGTIDHVKLEPGVVVRMHEHRNDEIISYMRAGNMKHTDSTGRSEVLSSDRLMVMNAGRGFSHEEETVGDQQIEMLQIFVRPNVAELDAWVQFVDLDASERDGKWRLLTGPVGSAAPTTVRQAVYLYDAHLPAGASIDLPKQGGFDRWFYVFNGEAIVGDQVLRKYDALMISDQAATSVTAVQDTDVVVFLVDRKNRFSRTGTMSG
ncbi:MAG: pirin family protein [Rhizobium altiplani]|jgi:redox-sensitive bicupin YhaK (pirin superfamily)|uniref:pirin family protein n=1 Tax=Rhizobium altiplani TaxID=1864509 RepID=UPI000DD99F23